MNRKHQQTKLEELALLIAAITAHFNKFSDDLDEQDKEARLARLSKLQTAVSQLKKKLAKASPFAADPVPGFNGLCERIRVNITKEYIAVMRLTHKKFIALQEGVLGYEEALHQRCYPIDLEQEKDVLEDLILAFKRLGSRKLYDQDFSRVKKAIEHCERLRDKTENMFKKADEAINMMLSATEG